VLCEKGLKSWNAFVRISRRALLQYYRLEPYGSRSLKIFLEARDYCEIFAEAWVKDFTAPKPSLTGGSQWPWLVVAQTIVKDCYRGPAVPDFPAAKVSNVDVALPIERQLRATSTVKSVLLPEGCHPRAPAFGRL
jgi:hypothetical protein